MDNYNDFVNGINSQDREDNNNKIINEFKAFLKLNTSVYNTFTGVKAEIDNILNIPISVDEAEYYQKLFPSFFVHLKNIKADLSFFPEYTFVPEYQNIIDKHYTFIMRDMTLAEAETTRQRMLQLLEENKQQLPNYFRNLEIEKQRIAQKNERLRIEEENRKRIEEQQRQQQELERQRLDEIEKQRVAQENERKRIEEENFDKYYKYVLETLKVYLDAKTLNLFPTEHQFPNRNFSITDISKARNYVKNRNKEMFNTYLELTFKRYYLNILLKLIRDSIINYIGAKNQMTKFNTNSYYGINFIKSSSITNDIYYNDNRLITLKSVIMKSKDEEIETTFSFYIMEIESFSSFNTRLNTSGIRIHLNNGNTIDFAHFIATYIEYTDIYNYKAEFVL